MAAESPMNRKWLLVRPPLSPGQLVDLFDVQMLGSPAFSWRSRTLAPASPMHLLQLAVLPGFFVALWVVCFSFCALLVSASPTLLVAKETTLGATLNIAH